MLGLVASVGCSLVIGTEDYEFNGPGAGGTSGASGTSGAGGDGGTSGSGSSGSGGASGGSTGEADASTPGGSGGQGTGAAGSVDGGDGDGGVSSPECAPTERCVPEIPTGWDGPLAVRSGGSADCPGAYPVVHAELNSGFEAGSATCSCGCIVDGVKCRLESNFTGDFFDPEGSCDAPPSEDDCLNLVPDATCSPQPFEDIRANSWQSTELACRGATSAEACTGGACYPAVGDFGSVCISSAGDVACPAGFPQRSLYHQGFTDTRDCSACSCFPVDQECEMELEICSVAFYQVTLNTFEEQCFGSDDAALTVLSNSVLDTGTCDTSGGTLVGAAAPANPVTVCCLE